MSSVRKLKLALSHYDRFLPLYDGTIPVEGYDVETLHVGQSQPGRYGNYRHERMLHNAEFDVCEMSLSSYLMGRERGYPFTAIPVFPRRLFSQSQIWVNTSAGISTPLDLVGKKVGLGMMQTTMSVLAIGDIWAEYGVPWRKIEWYSDRDESIPFDPPEDVTFRRLPPGANIEVMLEKGELDAVFRPHPPKPFLRGSKNIGRFFANPKKEEERYFRKNGYFPIMHLVVFRDDVLAKHPEAPLAFMEAFRKADEISAHYYDDPGWSRLAWGRHYFEEERSLMGENAWPHGLAKNCNYLERFAAYSKELGLIKQRPAIDELFAETTRVT